MEKTRNQFIDIVKGVAIFLMLWGHCIQYCIASSEVDFFENNVFKFIYSFHMPLFMLLSGYLFFFSFSKRNLKDLLIYKTQSMLQPIVFCTLFIFFATTVLFNALDGKFGVIFNGNWLSKLSSLWFLWSVLAATLVTAIICKTTNSLCLQIILFFMMIPIVAIFPNMDQNLYMYPYFVLGFYFAKYKDKLPLSFINAKYITLPLFPILLNYYEKKHYIYITGIFPNSSYSLSQMFVIDAYRWLIGLVGSIFVITTLHFYYQHVFVRVAKPLVSIFLSRIGQKSLQIYVLSTPFLSTYLSVLFPKMLVAFNIDNIFIENILVYNFVFTLSLAIVYAFLLYYIVTVLEKTKVARIMFGK